MLQANNDALIELLMGLESCQNKNELEERLYQFMRELGIEAEILHSESLICLILTGSQSAVSLIWLPRESHYCPRLAKISDCELSGLSLEAYVILWRAFNAYCYAVWQLPQRYRQILEALSRGKTLQGIAVEVNLSLPSIKRYMGLIRQLLGATTNAQAIVIATRKGWI